MRGEDGVRIERDSKHKANLQDLSRGFRFPPVGNLDCVRACYSASGGVKSPPCNERVQTWTVASACEAFFLFCCFFFEGDNSGLS